MSVMTMRSRRRGSGRAGSLDPRVAELLEALANERLRPYWPILQAELDALTATSGQKAA